jgi:hypothetical protein
LKARGTYFNIPVNFPKITSDERIRGHLVLASEPNSPNPEVARFVKVAVIFTRKL